MTLLDALLIGSVVLLLWLGFRGVCSRAYLRVNPDYRPLLERLELKSPRALLRLPAVIVSGHPDRNVARVMLGAGPDAVRAYLKREHRVRWLQRFANWWAGFGPVSLSHREAITLRRLRRAGIGCPDWIAVGADRDGRAFLLVKEIGGMDLRRFLAEANLPGTERRRFARHLGSTLARLHDAGFAHPDLYAKHVLVNTQDLRVSFLDWQRSGRPHRVDPSERWRDLAALDATLADELASPRERLVCLRAYRSTCLAGSVGRARTNALSALARGLRLNERSKQRAQFREALSAIAWQRALLLHRRHVREARQMPNTSQELIWLDGEALCVTPEFYRESGHDVPAVGSFSGSGARCGTVSLPRGQQAFFTRRRIDRFLTWPASWFRRRSFVAPEVRQAGLLFRLQRYGVQTARLLAFGQRQVSPWQLDSFLLTQAPARARSLAGWLAASAEELSNASACRRRKALLREIGTTFRRLHAAGCYLCEPSVEEDDHPVFTVDESDDGVSREPKLILARVDALHLLRRPDQDRAARDLAELRLRSAAARLSRADELRILLAYLGCQRLTPHAEALARRIESQTRREVPA